MKISLSSITLAINILSLMMSNQALASDWSLKEKITAKASHLVSHFKKDDDRSHVKAEEKRNNKTSLGYNSALDDPILREAFAGEMPSKQPPVVHSNHYEAACPAQPSASAVPSSGFEDIHPKDPAYLYKIAERTELIKNYLNSKSKRLGTSATALNLPQKPTTAEKKKRFLQTQVYIEMDAEGSEGLKIAFVSGKRGVYFTNESLNNK
jgi:hypothetical protein